MKVTLDDVKKSLPKEKGRKDAIWVKLWVRPISYPLSAFLSSYFSPKHRPGGYLHSHPYPIPFYTVPSAYNERRRKPMTLSGPPSYRDITLSLSDYPKQFGTIGLRI